MQLYLLRHAIAVPSGTSGYPNDDRPLTDEGIRKMKKTAEGIAANVPTIALIVSSPLKRAMGTASIVARALNYKRKIQVSKLLLPAADPQSLIEGLSEFEDEESVMFVGHNPHLEDLAAALLGAQASMIILKKGGICH